jgi:hypothetical protein
LVGVQVEVLRCMVECVCAGRWRCGCDVRSGSGEGRRAAGRDWRTHGCVAIDHITLPSMVIRDLKTTLHMAEVQVLYAHQTTSHQQRRWVIRLRVRVDLDASLSGCV